MSELKEFAETSAQDFLKDLDKINVVLPIDKNYLIMLYQFFKDFEDSPIIRDYLINHTEISIDKMKNTKLVFHELVYRYIIGMAKSQNPIMIDTEDKYALQQLLDNCANQLVLLAVEQEKILKMPSIEKQREDKVGKKADSDKN